MTVARFEQLLLMEKIKVRPKALWRLHRELVYHSNILGTVVAPVDFVTDLGSIPRIPFAYYAFGGKGDEPAVIHDLLYSTHMHLGQPIDRATADAVYEEALYAQGYTAFEVSFMFSGVRAGGWTKWDLPNVPQFKHVARKFPGAFEVYAPA